MDVQWWRRVVVRSSIEVVFLKGKVVLVRRSGDQKDLAAKMLWNTGASTKYLEDRILQLE